MSPSRVAQPLAPGATWNLELLHDIHDNSDRKSNIGMTLISKASKLSVGIKFLR